MKKALLQIIVITIIFSCDKHENVRVKSADKNLKFQFIERFTDKNIRNNTSHQVDILYNGIDSYLGGKRNSKVALSSECLACESVREIDGNLLFAKRIIISPNHLTYSKKDVFNLGSKLKTFSDNRDRKNVTEDLGDIKLNINYIGISCNDSDFNSVKLTYPDGIIQIDSIINASVFEYDLDKNGQKEQFIIGARNCIDEFVIMRIR